MLNYLQVTTSFSLIELAYDYPEISVFIIFVVGIVFTALVMGLINIRIINKKNKQLIAATESQNNFLSRMSHDMRTPLNAIIGIAEIEKQNVEKGNIDKKETMEYINKSLDASQYLLSLINDILDMSKIGSDEIKLVSEVIDSESFINSVNTIISSQASNKDIEYECICKPLGHRYYIGDKTRLIQIIINLLNNAIKFTPRGGKVTFITEPVDDDGETATIKYTVKDNGIGISPEFMDKLFTPFTQEYDGITTEYGGTGLGLAIAQNLAKMMNGDITVESIPKKGTTFYVTVKIKICQDSLFPDNNVSEKNEKIDLTGMKILICEDNSMNTIIATKLLESKGCNVISVENGKLGLDKFVQSGENYFDLILMDIRMPVMDGISAAKNIRSVKRTDAKKIPIIAMTANAYAEDIRKSFDAGMNAHISKPIDPKKFYCTIAKYKKL